MAATTRTPPATWVSVGVWETSHHAPSTAKSTSLSPTNDASRDPRRPTAAIPVR